MNSHRLAAEFKAKLMQLGSSLTPIDLLEAYAPHSTAFETESLEMKNAVPALENCKYFNRFASPPNRQNGMYANTRGDVRSMNGHANAVHRENNSTAATPPKHDYHIPDPKREYLQQHGFVVMSSIHCGRSFGGMYAALCRDGMPVYVTADSVLHAWHKSFRAFYMDLEEDELKPMLELVLDKTLAEVVASGVSESGLVADIRDFLAVALFLISDVRPNVPVSRRVTTILTAITEKKTVMIQLFERQREVDFSRMEPHGHYTETHALTRYFQAFTWLTMIDFRISGDGNEVKELHQLRCASFLVYFLRKADMMTKFKMIEATLDSLVGSELGVESLTPSQVDTLLPRKFSLIGLCSRRSRDELMKLQRAIRLSHQTPPTAVTSHTRESPRWTKATELPMSFSFFGLHLAWDAFAFSRLVFDEVRYHPSKPVRSMASAVDMAFSVLGNDAATEVLAYRMASRRNEKDFARFRDGLPYASNLIALRELLDGEIAKIDPDTCSLSTLWMLALRELSRPSAHKATVFQSDVWKLRMMNTQISSYAQLKRNASLTQTPPAIGIGGSQRSNHLEAFVDPYPAFWDKMRQLATRCAAIPRKVSAVSCSLSSPGPKMERMIEFFFNNFANVMAKLEAISVAQASGIQLTAEQAAFLGNIMEDQSSQSYGSLHGWYPSLFLRNASQSFDHQHEAVAIWKSAPSVDRGDPGGVLHLRVSPTNLCVAVVGTTTFAGPVFTHNEFVATSDLTDKQFLPNAAFVTPDWIRDSFFATNN